MKFLDVPQSGSIAGTTHSHNRAGQYTRNRRAPVQPIGTGRRAFIRSAFGSASGAFGALTSSEQAAWQTYADSYPITDSLGQSITLTAHQMFVSINTQLINVLQSISTVPPAETATSLPVIDVFTATHVLSAIVLTLDGSGPGTDFILVGFARPQSGGRTFVSAYWQQQVVAGDATTVSGCGAAVEAQFGALVAGQRLFVKLTPVNQFGVSGVPLIKYATVA